MKDLHFDSFDKFIKQYNLDSINSQTLIISDIDGVLFEKMFSLRAVLGILNKQTRENIERLFNTECHLWLLTDRQSLFRYFPFVRQLTDIVKKNTSKQLEVYSNCKNFLREGSNKFNIIFNASKPEAESQLVVEKGIRNFEKVIYLGAQDLPTAFRDQELVERMKKENDLTKLTFVDIY